MGAKTSLLVYASQSPREVLTDRPTLDREATTRLAAALFPNDELTPIDDGCLWDTFPAADELCVGVLGAVVVIAAHEFSLDRPSELPVHFLAAGPSRTLYLHAMHSVVDWCAFAHWRDGTLVRSLSVSPEQGVIEERGARLPFERPFWAGEHPAVDPEEEPEGYPLPFHPLELGEAALHAWFGFVIEGFSGAPEAPVEVESVPLLRFRRGSRRRTTAAPSVAAPSAGATKVPRAVPVAAPTPAKRPWWRFWRR